MRIGRLLDHPTRHGDADYGRLALELMLESATADGLLDEPVELVDEDAVGGIGRVVAGARRLAGKGCALILGPSVTDFAVPIVPVLDELRVPAINWSGSGLARGPWCFQLKVGSLPDEAGHLVRWIAEERHHQVAIARERGPIGSEYGEWLRRGLASVDADVAADLELDPTSNEATFAEVADGLLSSSPSCVVYLGFGPSGVALCRALRGLGWHPPIAGNIGIGVRPSAEIEGVVFTDVIDESNTVLRRFTERFRSRYHVDAVPLGLAASHDLAATAIEAIRLAPERDAAGMRAGLEAIRGLPAACGAPGTAIGFAPWDRDGYKGPLVVLRQVRGGIPVTLRR
ncbi:MAG TPA: ABC transporter substrate-binding protein [Candidatus Binatia bacterium]|nr:ABC transporter substrate-binding protein [Candidatus Binatia bacterium]